MKNNKAEEENYKTFFNHSADFLYVLDMQGCIIESNQTVYERLKYAKSELEGQSVLMLHPQDRREEAAAILQKMIKGKAEICPIPLLSKDKIVIPVETKITIGKWNNQPALIGVSKDMTDLKFSEEKFSKAFYLSPAICVISDLSSSKYVEANDAFFNILEFTKKEVIGKTALELGIMTPESFSFLLSKTDKNGSINNFETILKTKNGKKKTVLLSAEIINIQDKKYRYSIARDITERKKIEEELAESENKFRILFENSRDAIMTLEPTDWLFTSANQSTLEMFKAIDEDELFSLRPWYLSPERQPDGRLSAEKAKEMIDIAMREGSNFFEWTHKRLNGEVFPATVLLTRMELDEKKIIQATVRDITEHKKAEEELKQSEARFRSTFDQSPVGAVIAGMDKSFIRCNSAFCNFLGYTENELIGKKVQDITYPEDLELGMKELKQVVKKEIESFTLQKRYLRKDGKVVWGETSFRLVCDENDKPLYFLPIIIDITKRKQTEDELRESEEKYRILIENSGEGIGIMNENETFIFTNPMAEKIFGVGPGELNGLNLVDFISKDDIDKIKNQTKDRIHGKNSVYDLDIILKDKSKKNILITATPRFEHNKFCGAFGIFRDITERKQMEQKLIDSEIIFRQLVNNTDTGLVVIDENGCVIEANEPYLRFTGIKSIEEIIGHSVLEWTAPDEFENNRKAVNLCSQQGYIQDFETVYQHPDGKRINIIIQASVLNLENNKMHIVSSCRDITERKIAEEELLESKALTEAIVENVPLMIFLKEATDLRFVLFNRAGEELLGYKRKDLLGKNDLDFFPPDQADFFISKDREVLNGKTDIMDISEEPISTAKKGKRLLHTRKVTIRGNDGKSKYLLGISEDITEHKKAEEEIKIKNKQLQASNAEKDKFFSIIAHDLRSPFSGFLKLTEGMVKKLNSMPLSQIQHLMELLNESASNLYSLLENLLEWANLQRNDIEFHKELIPLTDLVQHVIDLIEETSRQKEIVLHVNMPKDLKIYADNKMTESVLRNLIYNAVKFTPPKGEIFISAKSLQNEMVEVSIKDSGIGMNKNLLDNLFRIDSDITRPGTGGEASSGLGLLLCKEFVEKQGGKISVESKEGIGSNFRFTIPAGIIEN